MANGISTGLSQLFRTNVQDSAKGKAVANNPRSPSKTDPDKKAAQAANPFGDSVKVELSPEVEMYGKVVDLLQKKYENADVFVAGPGDDLSQIGGDLEYSIILSEDEMKLLSSDDPRDKDAKDKLLGQIDDAMKTISDMSGKIGENTGDEDEISNFGVTFDKDGRMIKPLAISFDLQEVFSVYLLMMKRIKSPTRRATSAKCTIHIGFAQLRNRLSS